MFTLYTSDVRLSHDCCPLIKFTDDTAGLIKGNDDGVYLDQIKCFVDYCDRNFLELNVMKTMGGDLSLRVCVCVCVCVWGGGGI